ncbi:MAG: site-specific integrase [Nitrospinota bacterium]|mgnify:CR=1 FL=1
MSDAVAEVKDTPRRDRKVRGLYRRDKVWYVRLYHKGKEWRFSTGRESKKGALRELGRARSDKAAFIAEKVKERDQARQMLTAWVDEYVELMKKAGRRDMRRRKKCVKALSARFPDKALAEVSRRDVEAWREELKVNRGPATVNRYLAYGSHLFSEARRVGLVEKNPFCGVERLREPPGRVRYLEPGEVDALLKACADWFRPILALAFETGCRKSELVNLLWKDVDFKAGFLRVRYSKNGESRHVPLTEKAIAALKSMTRRLDHPFVFSGRAGTPLAQGWKESLGPDGLPRPGLDYDNRPLHEALAAACTVAEIDDFRFHDARHHVGSWLAMKGVSLDARMAILGHKTERMARRYAHLSPEYLRKAMELFSGESVPKTGTENGKVRKA